MRFRLATTGAADPGVASIGNAFRTMALMPLYQQQAAEEGQIAQARQQVAQSTIAKNLAEAAIKQNELRALEGRGEVIAQMGAARAGMSVPEFQAGLNERKFGAPDVGPPVLPAPIPGLGPSGRTAAFDDALLTLYGPAMASPANHTNWDQLAKARGEYQDQGVLGQAVAAATGGDDMLMSRLNSVRGKREFTPFKAVGNTGTALNEVTGGQTISSPAMNALFGSEVNSRVQENNAQAGAASALARLRQTQSRGAAAQSSIDELDLSAAREGRPLPSTNKATPPRGADSTNAKFRNTVITAAMKKPEFAVMTPQEKQDFINTELAVAGLDPVQSSELTALPGGPAKPQGKPAGPGNANAGTPPGPDMQKAADVRARFKAGALTREQAKAELQKLGFQ